MIFWREKMIKGIGSDIVKVERVKEKLEKKLLTGQEEYKNQEHFAGLWAAKEAILKAMGCGISAISFKDIEIYCDEFGAPKVKLNEKAQMKLNDMDGDRVHITISHEKEYAIAFAVIE